MDADRNGTVTAAELEEFQRAAAAVEAQTRNRALFARLDADRNGQISQAEFARMASNTPAPNIVSMLTRFDINRDRSITLIEYRTRTLANFDKLDVDKDGVVTEVEMKAGGIGG